MKRVIVFHGDCHDGITALWCALQKWPNAEPYEGVHGEPPDLDRLRGADVVMVDFSWPSESMLQIALQAASLHVLDHHVTAEIPLRSLQRESAAALPGGYCPVTINYDLERSGAGLAWDVLVGGPRPPLVDHVEDRDLWNFALPWTREIHAACNSYPLTLEARNVLMQLDVAKLALEGAAILRYHNKLVESAARHVRTEVIGGYEVPSIACPNIELVSDLGHRLAKGAPFAAVWVRRSDGKRQVSLRSSPDGVDVSEVAKALGGGGHKHAAGFVGNPLEPDHGDVVATRLSEWLASARE